MSTWPNTATLGGILLDLDDGASFRVVETLTGWDDAPGIRAGLQAKAGQDGAWDASGNFTERVIEIAGFIEEQGQAAARAACRALTALRPQDLHAFVVSDPDSTSSLSAQVRVTVGLKPEWIGDDAFTYTLQITAPDPLRYGPATVGAAGLDAATPGAGRVWPRAWPTDYGVPPGTTPGAVVAPNTGTSTYWPTLRIDGPVTNPVVTMAETGSTIAYEGALLAGQWLDIDCQARTVLLNGLVTARYRVTATGDWLGAPPGGGQLAWSADDADPAALLTVSGYEGAWI